MSESIGAQEPQEPQERPDEDGPGTTGTKPAGRRRLGGRGARWAVAGAAAVVVVGGGVAAAAIHHHEEDGRGERKVVPAGAHEWRDGFRAEPEGRDGHDGLRQREGRIRAGEDGPELSAGEAPAPLPSLSAADAVDKAASAVKDGKVESLAPVTEQGGGRAWRIVVVGPDGVRHVVTVDGTGGTVTGNTVLGG
ncbi:hypothetical protein OG410_05425 [Streptomyces sp. NBC_00659]|uniref:hypothetical protein n=1 Tax=Streptomyces sp. NBC_00659 TaxID=2903669 RepID=UPI002E3252DC|nr:hypothetical protein [Streptomyces sp. NBC_00659]